MILAVVASWCSEFVVALMAEIVGGAIVLFLGYVAIERRLRLRDSERHRQQEEGRKKEAREAVLRHVLGEIASAISSLDEWVPELAKREGWGVPYPGFDVTGWSIVADGAVLSTLKHETISLLALAYNRMRSANGHLEYLSDLNHGPTALLVNVTLAAAPSLEGLPQQAFDKFDDLREQIRADLVDRMKELRPHLCAAIDAVEAELGIVATATAEQRRFVHVS